MALPFLEGEVFFVRKALEEPHFYKFFPDDPEQFYGHMLIEHVWNRWTVSINTKPNFDDIQRRPHPRSKLESGRAQGLWRTVFGHFPEWWINFGNDRQGRNIRRTFNAQPNQNRNEMRDLDRGGPAKVVFRPVPLGTEEFVFIDMTQPVRAVYFPIAHQTEEDLPNLCTYLMVDFRLRSQIRLRHPVSSMDRTYSPDRTYGLHYDVRHTLGIHIPSLIESISWPRQLRGERADLYRSIPRGEETIFFLLDRDIQQGRTTGSSNFVRLIDITTLINAHQGIDINYRPFQYRSFVADALKQIIGFGLGFVPGVGTLLTISFNVAFELIMYPDQFREVFGPSLGFDIVSGLVESSQNFRNRSSLPRPSEPLTLKGHWDFEDRMPPPTSPKHGATSPSEAAPLALTDRPHYAPVQANYMSEQAFKDRMPPPTSPKHAAGPPSEETLQDIENESTEPSNQASKPKI